MRCGLSPRQHSYIFKFIEQTSNVLDGVLQVKLISHAVAIVVGALLLIGCLSSKPVLANPAVEIRILFDFGDGTYVWANHTVADPAVTNATWLAVANAAQANGIPIASTWYPSFGVAILDVGNRHPPAGFVGLYEWNATAGGWDLTSVGISSLVVSEGDAIALYDAGFDSHTFDVRQPVPTPDDPLPSVEFRGDLANSGASSSSVPGAVDPLWDRDTGVREIAATPAVAYGRLFVTTMHGLFALNARTGAILWTAPSARGFSSPAIFDHSVFVGTSNGTVVRLNASDGNVQWETRLLAYTLFSGITSSPKVAFDRVFIGTFNESGGPGEVVSLWANNGSVAWRHATGSVDYSSPAFADGTVYVGVMGTYNTTSQVTFDPPYGVLALNATTGEAKWFFPTVGSVAASPAIAGPRLIVPSKDGDVYAIDRESGTLAWNVSVDAGISSPAVFGGTVFVGGGSFGGDGRVVALDAASGALRWSSTPNGPVQASLTYADGKVIFATNAAHGRVYALDATSGGGVWSFEPSPAEYILGSPVVADGIVFAPSDNGHVYALGPSLANPVPTPSSLSPWLYLGAPIAVVGVIAILVGFVVRRRSRRGP
jgi:outer membrane protein assembly factor BamB